LLGLIGNITTFAEIQRWAEIHYPELKTFLRFRRFKRKSKSQKKTKKIPHAISMARILRKLSLADLQGACGDDWGGAWTVLSSMAWAMARLMKKNEKTLKEVRERSAIKPMETDRKIGVIKNTC
jgi:hypothetical protein